MEHFRSFDGTRLAYRLVGSGPPLLCLAGGPGADVRSLGDLGGLHRRRTLVLLDARAAGASEVPRERASCAFTAQAGDVEALRRHLGLARVDLLAHSAGTLTAQEYAAAHPGRVATMMLVTPAGRVSREPDDAEVAAIRAGRAGEPWYPDAAAAVARLAAPEPVPAADRARLAALAVPFAYAAWTDTARAHEAADHPAPPPWLRAAFYTGTPDAGAMAGRLARLAAVPAPVLAVAGALDGIAGTVPARLVAATYPAGRLAVLPGCGHWPWIDDPAAFSATVLGFPGR